MKIKNWLQILGIILFLMLLFRGTIFNLTVHYSNIGYRKTYKITNDDLLTKIQERKGNKHLSFEEIIALSQKITTEKLQFSTTSTSQNPNKTFQTGKAHCVGYAAMFHAIANHLIEAQNEKDKYFSTHLIGQLNFLGQDVHQLFSSPFFKDHDFNQVYNSVTKEAIFIDASVSDYLFIDRVTSIYKTD